ncbi:MAG: arsenate reductase [Bacteroidia bacterium]|jgi:arsenate reductase
MSYMLYGIPNCDTVKKAKNWLSDHKIEFQFHNYKNQGIGKEKLQQWLTQVPLDKLMNKASATYKKLTSEQKEEAIDVEYAINLMSEHTSMIKRPVLEIDNKIITLGFKAEHYTDLLLHA